MGDKLLSKRIDTSFFVAFTNPKLGINGPVMFVHELATAAKGLDSVLFICIGITDSIIANIVALERGETTITVPMGYAVLKTSWVKLKTSWDVIL